MADEQELQHLRVILDYLPCEDCEDRVPEAEREYMCSICSRLSRNVSAEIAVPRWRTENGSVVAVEGRDIEELRPEVSIIEEEEEEPEEDLTEELEVLEVGVEVPEAEDDESEAEELPEWETVDEEPHTIDEYTLYTKEVTLRGGRQQQIYFFAKKEKKDATPCAKPAGYEVVVNDKTGLPVLKKKKK